MELHRAIEILRALESGANPFTGEVFPENTVYQHPDIVRALHLALRAMETGLLKSRKTVAVPEFAGRPWADEESAELLKEFDAGTPLKDISIKHRRSRGAVKSRLMKLGRVVN